MTRAAYREIRDECHDAMICSYVETVDVGWLVDEIFDVVSKTIRSRFGLGLREADLVLRDVRNEAEDLLSKCDLDNFVNLDQAIEVIAKYLTEDEETEKREEAVASQSRQPESSPVPPCSPIPLLTSCRSCQRFGSSTTTISKR